MRVRHMHTSSIFNSPYQLLCVDLVAVVLAEAKVRVRRMVGGLCLVQQAGPVRV
jgi:hypothetical protein